MSSCLCRHCGFAGDVHANHCPEFRLALLVEPSREASPREETAAVLPIGVFARAFDALATGQE